MSLNCTTVGGEREAGDTCTAPPATIPGSLVNRIEMTPDALSMLDPTAPSCTVASFYTRSWTVLGFQYSEEWSTYADGEQPLHPAKWEFDMRLEEAVTLDLGCEKWARPVPTDVHDCYIRSRNVVYPSPYAADLSARYTLDINAKTLDIYVSWTCSDLDPGHP